MVPNISKEPIRLLLYILLGSRYRRREGSRIFTLLHGRCKCATGVSVGMCWQPRVNHDLLNGQLGVERRTTRILLVAEVPGSKRNRYQVQIMHSHSRTEGCKLMLVGFASN